MRPLINVLLFLSLARQNLAAAGLVECGCMYTRGAFSESVSGITLCMALRKVSGLEQVTVPRMASFMVLGIICCTLTDTGSAVRCILTESLLYRLLFPKSCL